MKIQVQTKLMIPDETETLLPKVFEITIRILLNKTARSIFCIFWLKDFTLENVHS